MNNYSVKNHLRLTYYKELDGVRALAALMVMFFHFFSSLDTSNYFWLFIKKISVFGQTGVSLFFVLSGFLITRILLSTKRGKNYFINFYLRRSLRIFPLYYLFLVLYYYVLPYIVHAPVQHSGIYYWGYLQDFAMTFNWPSNGPSHFWSLAVEEHFYIFWPFLIYFFNNKKIFWSVIILITVSFAVRYWLISIHKEVFYFTFSRMDELALGALLGLAEAQKKWDKNSAKKFLRMFIVVIIPTVAIWVLLTGSGNSFLQMIKFTCLAFAFYSFIGFIINSKESNVIKNWFRSSLLVYTGKISYGLYVFHPTCFLLYNHFLHSGSVVINFFGSMFFCFIVASISFHFFENFFLKAKGYFKYVN